MGYGGPRVEFYTANQYANHAAAIQREDAARVRSIVDRRTSTPESEQLRRREEAFRQYEAQQAAMAAEARAVETAALEARERHEERQMRRLAAKVRYHSLSTNEAASRRAHQAHLHALAQPRQDPAQPTTDTTYGCVMHSSKGRTVYPKGRNKAAYAPGVDRDRIVPVRPLLDGSGPPPPWVGSYSTHHGAGHEQRQAVLAEVGYYSGTPNAAPNSATKEVQRQQQAAAAENDNKGQNLAASATASAALHKDEGTELENDDMASVFSHGSSNGPIRATGNTHVSTVSTKESVQLHLSRHGGAMTAPRPQQSTKQTLMKDLTLPELSHRLVKMQAPPARRC